MYEDINSRDLDNTEESDGSYSYPSYSRFTFTGKPKSRLGRNNKQARSSVRKNDNKEDKLTNPGEMFSGETSAKLSSQFPKPTGINWLRGDANLLTNPFTSGIFSFSKNVHESQQSNNMGSQIDFAPPSVSSQSNFLSTLKNDSAQSLSCNRNPTFNKTPFKGLGSCESNPLKEQNQYLARTPIQKLDFSCGKQEENKENAGRKLADLKIQEDSLNPSWNQLKKICDAAVLCPPSKISENSHVLSGNNRNNFGRTATDPFKCNIFPSLSVCDITAKGKDDDDSTNTPLDLSSGDSLTNKNIFNRSVTGSDQSCGTVVSLADHGAQKTEQEKHCIDAVNENTKQRNSSDAISSILPTFLAPTLKIKSKEFEGDDKHNSKYISTASDVKNPNPEFKNKQFLPFDEFPNRYAIPAAPAVPQFSSNKSENGSGKQNDSKKDIDKEYKNSEQNPFYQHSVIKDDVPYNISTKNVSPPIVVQPIKSTLENKPDTYMLCQNGTSIFAKDKENIHNYHLGTVSNNSTASKLSSNVLTEKIIPIDSNHVEKVKNDQSSLANLNTLLKTETLNSDHGKTPTVQGQTSPPMNKASEQVPLSNNPSLNPVSSERMETQNPNIVVSSIHSNCDGNVSKLSQIDVRQSGANLRAPHCPQQQIFPNNLQKVENHVLQHSTAKCQTSEELKIESQQMKVIEPLQNHVKQHPVEQQRPFQKQNSQNRDLMVFNRRSENIQQLPGHLHQQKTYLAPHNPPDNRIPKDFPHKKPEIPQHINNRPSFAMMDKPQNSYKMPPPRGRLPRANAELYVNGKVYTILSILGRGGSSEVYQVLDPRNSKLLAVKCVDLSMVDKTIADGYLNEIDLLSKLQGCSSVIKMFDYEYVQEYKMLYVVIEKGDTDLSQLIRDISKTTKISMSMIIYYWTEMLTAVRDIHEQGIIHSDLKPANFLLVSGRLKLIDFGIASSQGDMTSVVKEVTTGTWNYMSPEAIRNTSTSGKGFKITYKSDVWSLGCILYNLVYGKTPFSHITNTWGKLQAIADSTHQIDFPDVGAPVVLAQALRSCFHRDPKLRPTVAELLSLPYHATYDPSHIGRQVHAILPQEWWSKVAHLFPETKFEEKSEVEENKGSGTKADLT